MSGETESNVSGWTVDVLKAHFDQRFADQEKAVNAALAAAEKAVARADSANEKRFDSVNEFRASLSDATRENLTRAEADARFNAVIEKVDDLIPRVRGIESSAAGRSQGAASTQYVLFAIIGVLIGIGGIVLAATN